MRLESADGAAVELRPGDSQFSERPASSSPLPGCDDNRLAIDGSVRWTTGGRGPSPTRA